MSNYLPSGIQSATNAQVSAAGTAAQINAGFAATASKSAGEQAGFGLDQLVSLAGGGGSIASLLSGGGGGGVGKGAAIGKGKISRLES